MVILRNEYQNSDEDFNDSGDDEDLDREELMNSY